ncbi:MAG: ABC transporter ATP-binding protein [Endomicrobiales bacterium]|jgi:ABC-2 type transport system ATP-binding protein
MPNTFAINTLELSKKFGDTLAVDALNLEVRPGEIFAFLGPNGAGKTTTVKLLSGLLRPTSGRVLLGGTDLAEDPRKAKSLIGLVSEQPFVYLHLTGFEFMRFVGDLYRVPVQEQATKISELLLMFELSDVEHQLIESYSHGMKQKLVLASVLLHRPEILLLDEPLVGLDPKSARLVKDIFAELSHRGVTIFMCTHVLEIAQRLANRIAIISRGSVISSGTLEELRAQRASSATLEDIFLAVTGGSQYGDLLKYL